MYSVDLTSLDSDKKKSTMKSSDAKSLQVPAEIFF